jgi:uncharacterized protein
VGRNGSTTADAIVGAVDCCVHVTWATPEEFVEYLPAAWREQVAGPTLRGRPTLLPYLMPRSPFEHPTGAYLPEAMPTGALTPEELLARHVEPHGLSRAVLCPIDGLVMPAVPSHFYALEIVRATNRWLAERFLDGDERFAGSILVPSHLPEEAAAEIRRWADHPRMVQVLLGGNGLGRPFGHPLYRPIFEAAAEAGLPVAIHAGGDQLAGSTAHPAAGGLPSFYTDASALAAQSLQTHVASIVVQGVFERLRDLRVLAIGGGVGWIGWLVWRLNMEYRAKRRETPWLERSPSQGFREHVRVATYPLEAPADPARTAQLVRGVALEDGLCYASGYPSWDCDSPAEVAARLSEDWAEGVLRENAAALYAAQPAEAVAVGEARP